MTVRANGGSPFRRAPRWAAGLRRGHSLLQSRSTHYFPHPTPLRVLFPATQMRELTRVTATFQPSTPYTPPSPVQALGLGASNS